MYIYTYICSDEKYASMNWDELGFDLVPADYMYIMKSSENGCFSNGTITRYGNIEISPASVILNFGQVYKYINIYIHIEIRIYI